MLPKTGGAGSETGSAGFPWSSSIEEANSDKKREDAAGTVREDT